MSNNNYIFLKSIEIELLDNCDVTITVSDTVKSRFQEIGCKRLKNIFLSADAEKLVNNNRMTKINGLVEYCYVGALTQSTWHRIEDLHKLYIELRQHVPKSRLKIITTSSHDEIKKKFSLLPEGEIIITRTKNTDELKKELKTVDFGLLQYRNSSSLQEDIVGDSILGAKTVEYIAAGLPIIVNKNCGGTAKVVDIYNLGLSYNPNTFEEIDEAKICRYLNDERFKQRPNLQKSCLVIHVMQLSIEVFTRKLFNLGC